MQKIKLSGHISKKSISGDSQDGLEEKEMVGLGADHGGYALKETVKSWLEEKGIAYRDFGCCTDESVDYADMAEPVCGAVLSGECEKALLFCGTGLGMSMAANRRRGIRAAVCSDSFSVTYTRLHNDANVLCLGGRVVGSGLAVQLVELFLQTPFEGGRHARRIAKLEEIQP